MSKLKKSFSVSIVIPTYQRESYLFDALQSIQRQDSEIHFEILVMDNACDNNIKQKIEKNDWQNPVRYIPVQEIGLHNCRNKAIQISNGEILVFIDDDVLVLENWLRNLVLPFKEKNIAMVGGKTLPVWEGDKPQWLDSVDPTYFSLLDLGPDSKLMHWPETPYGCNMAVNKTWAENLAGFSPDGIGKAFIEWYRGDGETGFARKIYKAGGNIYYSAEACLNHRIPQQRMSKGFLYRRTMKSAISSFYADMRENNYSDFELCKLLIRNIFKSMGLLFFSFVRLLKGRSNLEIRINALNHLCKALYQSRLIVDQKLRAWVKKESYM